MTSPSCSHMKGRRPRQATGPATVTPGAAVSRACTGGRPSRTSSRPSRSSWPDRSATPPTARCASTPGWRPTWCGSSGASSGPGRNRRNGPAEDCRGSASPRWPSCRPPSGPAASTTAGPSSSRSCGRPSATGWRSPTPVTPERADRMDFDLPPDLVAYLAELDDFIEQEIRPLEADDDNGRFFDHRREDARTDWERGGLPSPEWEALLAEMRRRADAGGHLRYALPGEYGGRNGTNLALAVIREYLARLGLGLH